MGNYRFIRKERNRANGWPMRLVGLEDGSAGCQEEKLPSSLVSKKISWRDSRRAVVIRYWCLPLPSDCGALHIAGCSSLLQGSVNGIYCGFMAMSKRLQIWEQSCNKKDSSEYVIIMMWRREPVSWLIPSAPFLHWNLNNETSRYRISLKIWECHWTHQLFIPVPWGSRFPMGKKGTMSWLLGFIMNLIKFTGFLSSLGSEFKLAVFIHIVKNNFNDGVTKLQRNATFRIL